MGNPGAPAERQTCFVVMGFGEKTDFQANPQRKLNLNRTYEGIIKPAVTACGLECIRADEVIHSTVIDKPMYELLLGADLVIADLSTSNANALYELGVRHALRPHTTIVIADNGFSFPFDLGHLLILKYDHLGPDVGFQEALRMQEELKKRIPILLEKKEPDSPVFVFLPGLLGSSAQQPDTPPLNVPTDSKSVAELMDIVRQAKRDVKDPADWLLVVAVLNRLRKLQPDDSWVIQQLALATYKSKQPDTLQALQKARGILEALGPATSSDAETVGLWGAIHKRLWEVGKDPNDLDRAVRAYARGYFIKNDYYNAINFAFLLNVRAAEEQGDEAIADRVQARRIREEVLPLCDALLGGGQLGDNQVLRRPELEQFWVGATKVEALMGLGRTAEAEALRQQLLVADPTPEQWMVDTMNDQLGKLAALNP